MEDIKGKIFTGIFIVVIILGFCLVFWLLFYQNGIYYTRVDNSKVDVLESGDMRYEYTLDAYNENGKEKQVTFKTSRELKEGAYLKLDVMLTRGVKSWEEVRFDDLPSKVKAKYE